MKATTQDPIHYSQCYQYQHSVVQRMDGNLNFTWRDRVQLVCLLNPNSFQIKIIPTHQSMAQTAWSQLSWPLNHTRPWYYCHEHNWASTRYLWSTLLLCRRARDYDRPELKTNCKQTGLTLTYITIYSKLQYNWITITRQLLHRAVVSVAGMLHNQLYIQ